MILLLVGLLCLSQNSHQMGKSYVAILLQGLHEIHDASTVLEVANVVCGFSGAGHNMQHVKLGRRTGARTPPSPTRNRPVHMVSPTAPQKPSVNLLPPPPPPRRISSTSSTP
ncbi:hypothetical protein TB2_033128 [Malus domestica]